ncbi:MAG: chromate transporter [Firmicutes bacterium]|nr:chromate transporter [Bacillota bacterium]
MQILIKLFFTFAKIGLIGFGGGMAILPLIYDSVIQFNSMDPDEFANLFAISQATPGPLAVNAATFSGFQTAGVFGALAATIGVSFPAFILVGICVKFLDKYKGNRLVEGAFEGARPVAVGMIMAGFITIGQTALLSVDLSEIVNMASLFDAVKPIQLIMAVATFILAKKFKMKAFHIIIIMGVLGTFLCKGAIL